MCIIRRYVVLVLIEPVDDVGDDLPIYLSITVSASRSYFLTILRNKLESDFVLGVVGCWAGKVRDCATSYNPLAQGVKDVASELPNESIAYLSVDRLRP